MIRPKKIAVKYNPPVIALEYFHNETKVDYLLQINLEDNMRQHSDPRGICRWLFDIYGDVFDRNLISEKQVKQYIN